MSDSKFEDREQVRSIGSVVVDQAQIERMERALESLRRTPRSPHAIVAAPRKFAGSSRPC